MELILSSQTVRLLWFRRKVCGVLPSGKDARCLNILSREPKRNNARSVFKGEPGPQ